MRRERQADRQRERGGGGGGGGEREKEITRDREVRGEIKRAEGGKGNDGAKGDRKRN